MKHKHDFDRALELLEAAKVPDKKSEEENWNEFRGRVDRRSRMKQVRWEVAAAASVILCVAIGFFSYRATNVMVLCREGKQIEHILPDGSVVKMNAGSSVAYNSLLWNVSRSLSLAGEAYFEVEKGSKFTVESAQGITKVLGTTFTVYARKDAYRVNCFSGKVQVETPSKAQFILTPGLGVEQGKLGKPRAIKNGGKELVNSWLSASFRFNNVALKEVFEEVARRYAFRIVTEIPDDLMYSGFFKQYDIEQTMELLCSPFGLKYSIDNDKREIRVFSSPEESL